MEPTIEAILALVKDVGTPVVGVLLSFKFLLNGLKDDVKSIKDMVTGIDKKADAHEIRIVRLETLADPEKPVRLIE